MTTRRVSALYGSRALADQAAARLMVAVPEGEPARISALDSPDGERSGAFDRLATMLAPSGTPRPSGYLVSKPVAPDRIDAAAIALEDGADRVEIAAPPRLADQVIEFSETAEQLVIDKQVVAREEIVMRVERAERVEQVYDKLRRIEADIEEFGPEADQPLR